MYQEDDPDGVWPPKAYENAEFLNSPLARSIRVQCELLEPMMRFKRNEISHTIAMFGSARTKPPEVAETELKEAEAAIANSDETETAQLRLAAAKAGVKVSRYYWPAYQVARQIAEWSAAFTEPSKRFHVMSGGGPGMMEAVNRGAQEGGGRSIGLGISLPFEQSINAYCEKELSFEFHYFFIRKYWFLYMAKAIVVFPGGFGTMDELFEMLTLIQTRKTVKEVPIVLFGREFWDSLINFDAFVEWGVISPGDLNFFRITDSVEETVQLLQDELGRRYEL